MSATAGAATVQQVEEDTQTEWSKAAGRSKSIWSWPRLKTYVYAVGVVIILVAIVMVVVEIEDRRNFLTETVPESWPWILLAVVLLIVLAVTLASKVEALWNEMMDIKYTLKGLHAMVQVSHDFVRGVGEFVDKTEPELQRARDFMDHFERTVNPTLDEMRRLVEKIEKPLSAGCSRLEEGIVGAEKDIEKALRRIC